MGPRAAKISEKVELEEARENESSAVRRISSVSRQLEVIRQRRLACMWGASSGSSALPPPPLAHAALGDDVYSVGLHKLNSDYQTSR
jgi:hypothetical protein